MCGIVGIFSFDGPPPHRALWPALVNHLRHRGPDEGAWWADGPFFFGHRRLSILGLEQGGQPMATEDGELVVTSNGEIYNFVELREELESLGHRFRTDSDTEVLLHGYRAWGDGLPARLTGMFAFALADRRRRELFLARDRFGEKPLFVRRAPGYVAFASEVRPLAALPDLDRRVDVEALGRYLCLNYAPGPTTLLHGVHRLAPGTWTRLSATGERSGVYWQPRRERAGGPTRGLEAAREEWQEHFDRAVKIALRSDVPVGILLSGGIDSSLVAESAVRQGRLSCAYFLDFEEPTYSEYEAARTVADRLGLPLERATLTSAALGEFLSLVEHADDPLADSSALAVWVLARRAAQGNKVVLGGDGGDELFGGYLTYRASLLHDRVVARLPMAVRSSLARIGQRVPTSEGKVSFSYKLRRFLRAADLATAQAHRSWNGTWLPEEAVALIRPGQERETVRHALANGTGGPPFPRPVMVGDLQMADIAGHLPDDILTKVDRMSMAHGLETRAPFLNHDLAGWALREPADHVVSARGDLKVLLRAAARRVFGPAIADRAKQGFSIPIHAWTRGPLRETIDDLLSPSAVAAIGLLDAPRVGTILDDHFSGRRSYGFEIWGLAVLSAWHRTRVQRPPDAPRPADLVERRFAT